jgi:hypothetical protein
MQSESQSSSSKGGAKSKGTKAKRAPQDEDGDGAVPVATEKARSSSSKRSAASSRKRATAAPIVEDVNSIAAAASLNALQMDDDTVILKLDVCGPMTPSRAGSELVSASDFQPDPYNSTILNRHTAFESHPAIASPLPTPVIAVQPPVSLNDSRIVRLLSDFQEKSKVGEWPTSTQVHCYWCCHGFSTPPLGLPIRYLNGRFHVIGCFCSLECASAYNFDHMGRDSVDDCLMRHGLLNALSVKLGLATIVRQAPDRLALQIFGGHMSIQEFRAHSSSISGSTSRLIMNTPPMHCVTQHIEEISDHDLQSEYRYVPLDTDRISRYQEKVRLSRTKPLSNFKNTLDHTMNIKISSSSSSTSAAATS